MLKILLILTSCLSAQMYTVDDAVLHEINTLEVTYIDPMLKADVFIDHHERVIVLKIDTLLDEIKNGRHHKHATREIIDLVHNYVDMNKARKRKIFVLNSSMEAYLK